MKHEFKMKHIDFKNIEQQLELLETVANELVNGSVTSANIAHDGKIKGYTIRHVVKNIRDMIQDDKASQIQKKLAV